MAMPPNIIIAGPTGTLIIAPTYGSPPATQRFKVFSPHGAGPAAQMQAEALLRTLPQNPAAEQDARQLYEQRGFFMPSAQDLEHLLKRDLTDGIFITAY